MRHVIIAAAALALGVLPATAQSGSSGGQPAGAQKGSQAQTQGQSSHMSAMSQDKLRKTLQQSGFTDIQIVDAAYIVHAKTSDGNMVVMYIDPPGSATRASQSGSSGQSTTGSASPSSGSGSGSTGSGSSQSK